MTVRIITAHVLEGLVSLPDESVHCVCTSPPYYGLRDYGIEPQVWGGDLGCGHEWGDETKRASGRNDSGEQRFNFHGQAEGYGGKRDASQGAFCLHCNAWLGSLGLEPIPSLYIEHMVTVFREIRRVLRKDGTCWLNIGDSYAANGSPGLNVAKPSATFHGGIKDTHERRAKSVPIGLKPKDLLGIPWALAFALRDDGWWLRSEITWAKRAPMPESCTDRPTSATEKVFLLTKSGTPTYWTHRDHEGSRTKPTPDYRYQHIDNHGKVLSEQAEMPEGWQRTWPHWKRINLWDGHDYFYDAIAVQENADGDTHSRGSKRTPPIENAGIGHKDWCSYMDRDEEIKASGKRNLRNFLLLGPAPFAEAHFATFVPRIPEIAILAGTSEKGCCPKCGAPWERMTKKTGAYGKGWHDHSNDLSIGQRGGMSAQKGIDREAYENHSVETIGWQPTCSCNAGDPVPATVIDPFAGAFTTSLVAERLRRDSIAIELSPAYVEMGKARLMADAPLFCRIIEQSDGHAGDVQADTEIAAE